jgi:hypothetical protein
LRIDKGVNSWHAKYFSVFAGETVDRFYSRAPSGSAADVKAKGLWKKGEWILEFSRTLKSPNEDDIDFSDLKYIFVVFSAAMPDMSDFSTRSILEFEPEIYEKN